MINEDRKCVLLATSSPVNIWATSWQNQQNGMCTQRRLRSAWASAQSDQSSLCAQWVAKDPSFLHADSKDSDQTDQMPRLIWVFTGGTCHFVDFVMRQLISFFFINMIGGGGGGAVSIRNCIFQTFYINSIYNIASNKCPEKGYNSNKCPGIY